MVLLFLDGFDAIDSTTGNSATTYLDLPNNYDTVTVGGSAKVAAGRYAGYALELDDVTLQKNISPTGKIHCMFNLQTNYGGTAFEVHFGSNTKFVFQYDMMGGYYTCDSTINGSTVSHTNIGDLSSWKCISIVLDPTGSTATRAFLDNVQFCNRTASFTSGNYVKFVVGPGGGSYTWTIDHLLVNDFSGTSWNNRYGKSFRIKTLFGTADSTPDQWTANGVTDAYDALDSVPPTNTKYIESGTDNDVTQVSFGNLTDTPVGEIGVAFKTIALNTDGATLKTLATVIDSSGTPTEVGTDIDPGTSETMKIDIFGINPIGSTAWTTSAINGLIAGVKSKA